MAQNPIKKVKMQSKPSKYKKTLKNPKNESQRITKTINKGIVDKFEIEYKAVIQKSKPSKKK